MMIPEAHSREGLQLQQSLAEEMLCNEISSLDILHNGANTRRYENVKNFSEAELIIIARKMIKQFGGGGRKLRTILEYYTMIIDDSRRMKEMG